MSIDIRAINKSEIPTIIKLACVVWSTSMTVFLTKEQVEAMLESIYALESLASEMQSGHVFWIASEGGKDLGFVSAYKDSDTVWIKKLYILPESQGKGLGKKLMQVATEHFMPVSDIALFVNEHNSPAIQSYERMGFEVKEKVPVKMGPFDFIDCIMRKAI